MNNTFADQPVSLGVLGFLEQTLPGHEPRSASPPRRAPRADAAALAKAATVMIVDDEPLNVKLAKKYLSTAGYERFVTTSDSREFESLLRRDRPDVILLDIMMPHLSGLDILARLAEDDAFATIPVIVLTATDDEPTKLAALDLGAFDLLNKPVNGVELAPRVRNALVLKAHHDHLRNYAQDLEAQVEKRTAELAVSRLELIHCLARAAEYRDNETGNHVIRVGRYAGVIARALALDPATVELIEHAAPLHDMGKIGIPDAILHKPDRLSEEEWEVMRKHPLYGKRTFEPMSGDEWKMYRSHTFMGEAILEVGASPLLQMAGVIALTHHEKWDGSGYPIGLSKEDIPLPGRITAVADVFDALSTARPYKPAFPLDKCFQIMLEGRGTHFDPRVLDAFFARKDEIIRIRLAYADVT